MLRDNLPELPLSLTKLWARFSVVLKMARRWSNLSGAASGAVWVWMPARRSPRPALAARDAARAGRGADGAGMIGQQKARAK